MTRPIPTEPAPLEPKLTLDQRVHRLERAHNALLIAFDNHTQVADTAYPGADRRRHYDQHVDMTQKEIDRREFWKKLVPQIVGGLVIAAASVLGTAVLFFVRKGGV